MPIKFPSIYLLEDELPFEERKRLDTELHDYLITDIRNAELVVIDVKVWRRARMHLQKRLAEYGLTTEVVFPSQATATPSAHEAEDAPRAKQRKVNVDGVGKNVIVVDSSTESDGDNIDADNTIKNLNAKKARSRKRPLASSADDHSREDGGRRTYKVVKLEWCYDSMKAGRLLLATQYLVYEGRERDRESKGQHIPTMLPPARPAKTIPRLRDDTPPRDQPTQHKRHRYRNSGIQMSQPPALITETTSDDEEAQNMPPLPFYFASCFKFHNYSCHRPTPLFTPNDTFIDQLKVIRDERELTDGDEGKAGSSPQGLAYSKAISSIAAYPFTIRSTRELCRLPNCGPKFGMLYKQWREYGSCEEVEHIQADEEIQCLKCFSGIYEVGPKRARHFYANGWRDLDDCAMNWDSLTRNQQYGLKYYDDFNNNKIPREEVERIAAVILKYANKIHEGYQIVIVGGYRRGKPLTGDVDVILTHPDEEVTQDFIEDLNDALFDDGWIKHRLHLTTKNSDRNQEALAWKGGMGKYHGGFCTLDKSFVIWEDAELAKNSQPGKSNPKRRVDIIISPWKTAGCAIMGWTGQTMFERDLRKYCRKTLGYKFDSSGVRRESDGAWMDFEGDETDLLEKEKKVFAGLKLEWREPTERCTG